MLVHSLPMKTRKGWLVTYFILLPHVSALFTWYRWHFCHTFWPCLYDTTDTFATLFMTTLTRTVGHKMAAFLVTVLRLSNASFYQTGWEIEWKTKSVSYLQWSLCTLYITRMPCFFDWLMIAYRARFSTLRQTHCARLWFYMSDWLFLERFLNIHQSGVLMALAWLVWCHMKLLSSRCKFCVYPTTMHHVTSCEATYVKCMRV